MALSMSTELAKERSHFSSSSVSSAFSMSWRTRSGVGIPGLCVPLLSIYAASHYLTMQLTPAADATAAQTHKTTAVTITVMLFWMFLTYKLSSAFIFYWLVFNLLSVWQQYNYIYRPNRDKLSPR